MSQKEEGPIVKSKYKKAKLKFADDHQPFRGLSSGWMQQKSDWILELDISAAQ